MLHVAKEVEWIDERGILASSHEHERVQILKSHVQTGCGREIAKEMHHNAKLSGEKETVSLSRERKVFI